MEKWLPRRQFWAACGQPARAVCRFHTRERHSGAGDQSAARVGRLEDDRLGAGGRSEVAAGGGGCRRVLVVEQHDDLRGRRDRAACDTAGVGLCAAQPVAGDAERDRLPAQRLAGAGQRCAGSNARAGGANTATLPHPQRTVHDRSQGNFLPTQARPDPPIGTHCRFGLTKATADGPGVVRASTSSTSGFVLATRGLWTVLCFGDLSPAQCRSVRQIDNISGTAGSPGRARVVAGFLCEGTLPGGSAADA